MIGENEEPKPARCPRCGALHNREAHVSKSALRPVGSGRERIVWATPKLDPCSCCAPTKETEESRAMASRLRGAGVPEPLWPFSLSPDRGLNQGKDEADEAFQERVRSDPRGFMLGVTRPNLRAVGVVRAWVEDVLARKHRDWLLLHGPPGGGKTTLLAALARRFLTPAPDVRVKLHDEDVTVRAPRGPHQQEQLQDGWDYVVARGLAHTLRRGGAVPPTLYRKVGDLGRKTEDESWQDDSRATKEAMHVRVLLLDELGTDETPQAWETRAIERLLSDREERNLITVLSTNRTPKELIEGKLYGARVASRIGAATVVAIGGPSWR